MKDEKINENSYLLIFFLFGVFSCIEKPVKKSGQNFGNDKSEPILSSVKIKTDEDWLNEGYQLKIVQVEDNKCACRNEIQYDTGERCRIHEYNDGQCGSLTPYPRGDKRGIGSEFCKKPRAVKDVSNHGHHTWFAAVTYKEIKKWVKIK